MPPRLNPVLAAMKADKVGTNVRTPADDEIFCTVPGCTGIVGPRFVLNLSTGKAGLCPKKETHAALVAADKTGLVKQTIAGLLHYGRQALAARSN